ncbi:hypothetical protein BH09PSE4_BH09PSE4_19260 [soil metagenome]
MTAQTPIATSFNGGELSPRMGGRGDTAVYGVGLALCENFVPTVEGSIVKRPGFEFITAAPDDAGWLGEFRFNLTQDYALLWCDGRLQFYTNGARIETAPGVPYEVEVPYSAAEARFVSCQQSYDRLYLDHANHPPARLTRTSATTFAYEVLPFTGGPFADGNSDEAVTVTASAATGIGITITASSPIFASGHVGAPFRIEAADFASIPAWMAGINGVAIGNVKRSDGKAYIAASAGITGNVQPIHTVGTEWDGMATGQDVNTKGPYGVQWTYAYDKYGVVRITAVSGDGLSATADVERRLPDSVTSAATFRWAHGAFSAAAGWPSVVLISSGRLCHFSQFELFGSVVGDFLNHVTTTASGLVPGDLAFRRTLATEDPVLWAVADRKIIVGTASREIAIGAINSAQVLSGDNIEAVPQSFYGSDRVFPVQIGTIAAFVQRGGRKLRQAGYDFGSDRYVAENITVWARHITRSGVTQLLFQKEPEELLCGVRGDGQMIVHPHSPEQEIKGFARIRHSDGAGAILSAVSISAEDGQSDEIWALVSRGGAKSVERMAKWRDDGDPMQAAFFVDSGVTAIAGIGQTHFSNVPHLAGEVAVLADGGVVTGVIVANDGTFDIPATVIPEDRAYIITVGRSFTATAVTLRPELGGQGNTSQGKRQRLVRIALRLIETVGIRIGAIGGKLDELIDREGSGYMDSPVPLFSSDSDRSVSGGWDRNGQAMFVSSVPQPATIVAAMPKIEVTS